MLNNLHCVPPAKRIPKKLATDRVCSVCATECVSRLLVLMHQSSCRVSHGIGSHSWQPLIFTCTCVNNVTSTWTMCSQSTFLTCMCGFVCHPRDKRLDANDEMGSPALLDMQTVKAEKTGMHDLLAFLLLFDSTSTLRQRKHRSVCLGANVYAYV